MSGGPYAFKLEKIDGKNSGATANSIQANATQPLPPATFTITKTASTDSATPGQPVLYTITVKNTGGTAGSTSFTDDHDDAITPSGITLSPNSGGSCAPASPSGNDVLNCTTMLIPAGGQQVFTYSADMPDTFSGTPAAGCDPGEYPVRNTASLAGAVGSATATVCVEASAQFAVTKTTPDTTVGAGEQVQYTITVTNTGDASGSTPFTDDFDDRLSPSTAVSAPTGDDCAPTTTGNKVFICTTRTLAAGASQAFTYTATVPDAFDDGGAGEDGCAGDRYPVINTVQITGGASDSVTLCVRATPAFTVTKAAGDTTADPGQEITYTITVENTGDAAGSTGFVDDFDDRLAPSDATSAPTGDDCAPTTADGNELFDCTTGTIPAGGSQTFTYTATMPESFTGPSGGGTCAPGSYPVHNTVTLDNDATSGVTVCVGAAANFTIAKAVDDETPEPGQTVHYTITVENTGDAAGSTSFTDDYDDRMEVSVPDGCEPGTEAGTFTCATGEVGAGESVEFTYDGVVPSTFGPTSGGGECADGSYSIANTAALSEGPESSVELCVAAAASYTVVKAISDETPEPGQTVTYTIRVRNTGSAAGTTSFVDDFDDRLTPVDISSAPDTGDCSVVGMTNRTLSCSTGVIPAGSYQDFTYAVTLPATFDGGAGEGDCGPGTYRITNAVELAGGADDSVEVCVPAAPAFVVAKSVDDNAPEPGDTVAYTITVTNNGNASGATSFTDDFDDRLVVGTAVSDPPGDDCAAVDGAFSCPTGTIRALEQQTFTYTATIPESFSGDGGGGTCEPGTYRIHNAVELAGGGTDSITLCVAAAPDFDVDKSVETDGEVAPGDTVEYTLTVTNNGDAAGATTIVDDFDDRLDPSVPAGCEKAAGELTCTTATIAAGDSESFVYTAVIPESFTGDAGTGTCDPGEFRIANSVTVTGTTAADSVDVCVPASPDFEVVKSADDTSVGAGDPVTYTITVTNTGTAPGSTDFTDDFDDRLDPGVAASDPAGNDCSPVDGSFACSTAELDPGESQSFSYTVTMPEAFEDGAATGECPPGSFSVVNSVQAGSAGDAVEVCVTAAPAFEVTKAAAQSVAVPGGSVDYVVTVRNTGTAAGSTSFTDVSDATIAEAPEGCELVGAHELSCSTGTIAAGESVTFSYPGTMPAAFTGDPDSEDCDPPAYPVRNVATLADGDEATEVVCVDADAEFTVEKLVDDSTGEPGQLVHYTITVTNVGDAEGSTTFVDDYDDRLDPTVPEGCAKAGGVLTCTTDDLEAGAEQVFEYDARLPETYRGESGVEPCGPGEFDVVNGVRIDGTEVASQTVCVPAAPEFGVVKAISDETPEPGQEVTYTVTVGNTGSTAGSTSFVDDYDDRLDPTAPEGCAKADGRLLCETGSIEPGDEQVFTYTATIPSSFTGTSGGNGCAAGTFPITNGVVEAEGATDGITVCVTARPDVVLTKASTVDVRSNGDQVLTYTLTWTNHGAAEARGAVLSDALPAGTGFVSCTGGCSIGGTTPTATWQVGSIAPRGGTSSVVLVVKVTNNAICTVPNQAKMRFDNAAEVSSNTVTDLVSPQPDPANARSSGDAVGLEVRASGILTLVTDLLSVIVKDKLTAQFGHAASSQSGLGGPATDSDEVLGVKLPANGSVLSAGVLTTTSNSSVSAAPAETRQTTTSEVAGVCLVPVAGICTVQTGTVRAVASTTANGGYATAGTTGSTIQSLKVVGLDTPVNLNQTTTIPLNAAIFGKNSYVAINERSTSSGLRSGKYVGDASVTMIHVKITGVLLGLQAIEIKVAQATAHSEFPKTPLCANQPNRSVSGHAYAARLGTNVLVADLTQGYVQISPLGGSESEQVAGAALPGNGSIVGAKVADTSSTGALTTSSATSRSWAEVAGDGAGPVCVLRTAPTACVVSATAVRSEARSTAGPAGSTSTDAGTVLVDLRVLGAPLLPGGLTPAPNTTINLPGIGFIILNEQFCDAGGAANHSCAGAPASGLTVRAVRVVVTVANNLLGLTPGVEVVVAEAHADSSFG
ncbi:MAG TPA: choice-of-anchor P family protein [Nocardioides sp.]|nr:choice-of-anchor P family protein [Nocardioides sp.]